VLIERIAREFEVAKVPYAIVGGVALALHGAPRGTVDVDIITRHSEENFVAIEKCLNRVGLVSRPPVSAREVFQFREEYISRRNLIAWSFYNPTNPIEVVDLVITHDLRDLRVETRRIGVQRMYVLSVEDLIAMKRASNRPQDREDIKMLERIKR